MHVCPKGHNSQAGDYCDECGTPITGASSTGGASTPAAGGATTGSFAAGGSSTGTGAAPGLTATSAGPPCPECATPRSGRFCEVCGYDFVAAALSPGGTAEAPASSASAPDASGSSASTPDASGSSASTPDGAASVLPAGSWRLVVSADRQHHERMRAHSEPDAEPVPFPAFYPERRFVLAPGQTLIGRRSQTRGIEPEIDLSGSPTDPAVSHAHALLIAQPDGTCTVVDLDSANGTYLNDADDPIAPNTPTPVVAGDRVHVGAWTTITLGKV